MNQEYNSLIQNGTWQLVDPHQTVPLFLPSGYSIANITLIEPWLDIKPGLLLGDLHKGKGLTIQKPSLQC